VTYLRYSHAISYQRLSQLMSELYGLNLSEGAIANLLRRVQVQLETLYPRLWSVYAVLV
jgi:transposase